MSQIYVVVDETRNIFRDFIQVKCIVENCDNVKSKLMSVPIQIKYLGSEKRIIAYICQQHFSQKNYNNDKYEISPIQKEIVKELKPAPVGDHQILFHNASKILDNKSCCFRENKKYQNLDTLLQSLSISSDDENIIKNQIKRIMTQKYFQLHEVQKKIKQELKKEAQQINPLYVISLIENKNQIVKVLAKIEYISIIQTHEMLQILRDSKIK